MVLMSYGYCLEGKKEEEVECTQKGRCTQGGMVYVVSKKHTNFDLDFCFVVKLVNLNNVWFSHSYLCQLLFNFYLW